MQLPKITQAYNYVKPESSKVYLPIELKKEAYNKIAKNIDALENAAKKADKNIYFVPKNENVLMNFGPHTSLIDVKLQDSEVLHQMNDLIQKTYKTL